MKAKLYVILGAHPSRTAMLMLQHKGIEYETVEIPPGLQPFAMRLLGFKADPGFSRQVDDRRPPMLRAADRLGTVPDWVPDRMSTCSSRISDSRRSSGPENWGSSTAKVFAPSAIVAW